MSRNTSILLGPHFDDFIRRQINSGRYSSASEVIRSALKIMEAEEQKRAQLITALEKGEQSGFVFGMSRQQFLSKIHRKTETGE